MNALAELVQIIYAEMRDMGYAEDEARDVADVVAQAIISHGWPSRDAS